MIIRLSLFIFLVSCSSLVHEKKIISEENLQPQFIFSSKEINFQCESGLHCEVWNKWILEIIRKSNKHQIESHFYKSAEKNTYKPKTFYQLLTHKGLIEIYYSDYHCLDGQISCTFPGENKIFFNKQSLSLNKVDWIRVFWHEVFHLVYPELTHISCTSCPDGNTQHYKYAECDKNTFSAYGFERYWLKTHAKKFSSDRKYNHQNKISLSELNNRICRKNSKI